eukprot:jgi/Picsp_1/2907/NSC_01132-R1_ribosomal small subunit rsm22
MLKNIDRGDGMSLCLGRARFLRHATAACRVFSTSALDETRRTSNQLEDISQFTSVEARKSDYDASLLRLVELPPTLRGAISTLLKESNPKKVRQLGQDIISKIKMNTLSKHRGGIQPNFHDELPYIRGSSLQQERLALRQLTFGLYSVDDMEDGNVESLLKDHPSIDMLRARNRLLAYDIQRKKIGSKVYNGLGALAYAVARLPSTYSALRNVLQHLKSLNGDAWEPSTVLDFGSGPGTAAWAAHSVWPSQKLHVNAIDTSDSMADIGVQILDMCNDKYGAMGGMEGASASRVKMDCNPANVQISWRPFLPRKSASYTQKYDLVVAAYVLSELRDDVHRHQVLNKLLHATKDYLVLMEHGTPYGFSLIESSKQHLLKVAGKLGWAVHVMAPCPHDGKCPLVGARSWCHFVQKFERTEEQRIAVKSLTGKAPRGTQSEKFSYVILARGKRKHRTTNANAQQKILSLLHGFDQKSLEIAKEKEFDLEARINQTDVHTNSNPFNSWSIPASRVLKPPLKRKGHVMIDICSALDESGAFMGGKSGTILRQIISKGKSRDVWGHEKMYRHARNAQWGQVWPLLYQISVPASESQLLQEEPFYATDTEEDNEFDSDFEFLMDISDEDEP